MLNKILILICVCAPTLTNGQEYQYIYSFFGNSVMPGGYFFSKATCIGGSTIKTIEGRLPVSESVFHTPGNALELQYRNVAGGDWKAVIYHQDKRGMDHFKKAAFLSFWILSDAEITLENNLPQLQFMKRDSSLTAFFNLPSCKPKEWQRILIPLDSLKIATHPENLIAIVFSLKNAADSGGTFYFHR
jgi:hypothetical protein